MRRGNQLRVIVPAMIAIAAALSVVLLSHPEPQPAPPIAFVNQSIVLPDEPTLPALPEIVQTNCTACHSAEMIANQPPLDAKKWAGEVKKMRETYHATISPADDTAIVAALTDMQASARPD